MQSTSRRAFLTGRRSASTPWEAFCQRMRRAVQGRFDVHTMPDGSLSARLVPKLASDVHLARQFCAEHGVVMALDGVPESARLNEVPVLWVEPGRHLSQCQRLEPGSTRWFVQPGCLLGELEAAGLTQFADLPCHITVAAWLADRQLCDWPAGHTDASGIVYASVLLANGDIAGLGPFGTDNQKPLQGAHLQQLIPSLFQLAAAPEAAAATQSDGRWAACYRLDALKPAEGRVTNLAHLLLGHGGDLGWVEWVVIDESICRPLAYPPYAERYRSTRAEQAGVGVQAADLDAQVKERFDPAGVFPHPGQDV